MATGGLIMGRPKKTNKPSHCAGGNKSRIESNARYHAGWRPNYVSLAECEDALTWPPEVEHG